MAKWAADAVMDAALDLICDATRLFVCSQQPTTYAEASTDYMLASATISGADFAKADGAIDGRKFTVALQSIASITNGGTATHVALAVAATSTLLFVTTCTSQELTAGNSLTVPAWTDTIRDPA